MKQPLLALSLLWVSAASAGLEPTPDVTAKPATRSDIPTTIAKKPAPTPTLRCWQFGRLIFEEPVASAPATNIAGTHVFESKTASAPLTLIDMQSATCLVK